MSQYAPLDQSPSILGGAWYLEAIIIFFHWETVGRKQRGAIELDKKAVKCRHMREHQG